MKIKQNKRRSGNKTTFRAKKWPQKRGQRNSRETQFMFAIIRTVIMAKKFQIKIKKFIFIGSN